MDKKINLPQEINDMHSLFTGAGYDLYLVGGCVRDHKMGIVPKDFDMVTNATPEQIEKLFGGWSIHGYNIDFTGKHFGVMRVFVNGGFQKSGYEIATYREDVSVGRNPEVKIGATIQKDAERRDFTINALYYDIQNGNILDFTGGLNDIQTATIKTPGDPEEILNADPLRKMRAIRFKARIGGTIDGKTEAAIKSNNKLEGLDKSGTIVPLSQERITEEIVKGIEQSVTPNLYLDALNHFDMFPQLFSSLMVNASCDPSLPKNVEIVLYNILKFNSNISNLSSTLHKLKFPGKTVDGVLLLKALETISEENAFILKKKLNKTNLTKKTIIEYAESIRRDSDGGFAMQNYKNIIAFANYEIKTDGDVLKNEGFSEGAELGKEILKREKENFLSLIS